MNPLAHTLVFLINVIANLYLWILILRIALYGLRANYYNPLSQFVLILTDPLVKPLKKLIPTVKNVELPTVVVAVLIDGVKLFLLFLLANIEFNLVQVGIELIGDLIRQVLNFYFYLIIVMAISSWFIQQKSNPVIDLIGGVVDPVLQPFRKRIPLISGIDLSPLAVLILIKILDIFLVSPLILLGTYL